MTTEACRFADHIIGLKNGKVVCERPADVITRKISINFPDIFPRDHLPVSLTNLTIFQSNNVICKAWASLIMRPSIVSCFGSLRSTKCDPSADIPYRMLSSAHQARSFRLCASVGDPCVMRRELVQLREIRCLQHCLERFFPACLYLYLP